MPGVAVWVGRAAILWLGQSVLTSAANTVEASSDLAAQVNKALPWVIGAGVVYMIAKGR